MPVRDPAAITRSQMLAYSGVAFSTALIAQPILLYLPQLYAKEMGIPLSSLGIALVLIQVVDAVSQQVFGYLSDRTRSPWGPRKPWVAIGTLVTVVTSYFLLRPPAGVGLIWFLGWMLLYNLGYTAKSIAYSAWGAELSGNYHQRSRIAGASSFAAQLGNLLNELMPILLFAVGLTVSSAYSMKVMGWYFVVGLAAIPIMHVWTLVGTPVGQTHAHERPTLAGMLESVRINRPFWRYVASFTLSGMAIGALALNFTFYDGYLHLGKLFPYLMTLFAVWMVVTVPFWVWLSNRIGKHKAYSIAMILGGCAPLAWLFLNPDTLSKPVLMGFGAGIMVLLGTAVGCNLVATSSILGDIVDFGALKTGVARTASYFAFYLLTTKVAMAVGSGLAFMTIAAFGYNAKAGAVNGPTAKFGLLLVVAVAPAVLKVAAGLIMWWFPLDARRHGIVQRRLQIRAARVLAAAEPDSPSTIDPQLATAAIAPRA